MRRGEVLGVRWKDLDLDSGQLSIVQTITNVDGVLTIGSPKTSKSKRVIYLDETTVTMMRQHRRRQREDQVAMGPDWGNSGDLAFTDEAGRPVRPEWFSRSSDGWPPWPAFLGYGSTTSATRTRLWR